MNEDFDKQYELYEGSVQSRPEEKSSASPQSSRKTKNPVDRLLLNKSRGQAANYTGDAESERDYRPIRQSHEYRSGCLGGVMYFLFIICLSLVLACLGWMAASDMLALNKKTVTATVSLPMNIFEYETVAKYDEEGNPDGTKRITHADMDYVADVLKDAGLIEYKWLFNAFCKFSHADTKLAPGEYELHSTYDYRALIQHMTPYSGGALTVKVTFPEGLNMWQMFLLLEENGVSDFDELMDAASTYKFKYSFLEDLDGGDASRLEGYLFPDTYEFYVNMQPASAINKFLETFHYVFNDDLQVQLENSGMEIRDVVTIASMIEKEAANDEERPLIASVIMNRMNTGMPLGIDATILYVHPEHEGAPTAAMLAEDSPYNTRDRVGLPPTPICSPGLASIKAALNPASTSYYYYALDEETGTHRFFTNSYEFDEFVASQGYGA